MEEAPAGGIRGVEDMPPELMLEIFSRLSIRSLFRIRSVCKQWDGMCRDPRLPAMQLARASASREEEEAWILTYWLDEKHDRSNLELTTLHSSTYPKRLVHSPGRCRFKHSCEGLLCSVGRNQQLFVSNPLTGEHLTLPPSTAAAISRRYGLGFDSSINKYKVVCAYYQDIDLANKQWGRSGAQVHTIGATASSSWRDIMSQPTVVIDDYKKSVYANGARHWLVDHNLSPNDLETMVISFDFETEEFKTIPRREFFSASRSDLVDLRGCLGMTDITLSGLGIWKLKDYERNQWVREYKINMFQPDEVLGFMGEDEIVLEYSDIDFEKEAKTLVTTMVAYNSKTYALRDIYAYTGGPHRLFLPRGSLVSLSL